jgi:hypothetical protein
LISENDASFEEDLDNGLQTAKLTIVPAELEVNITTVHSDLPPTEAVPETSTLAAPQPVSSIPSVGKSPEADPSPPPESRASSSKPKQVNNEKQRMDDDEEESMKPDTKNVS